MASRKAKRARRATAVTPAADIVIGSDGDNDRMDTAELVAIAAVATSTANTNTTRLTRLSVPVPRTSKRKPDQMLIKVPGVQYENTLSSPGGTVMYERYLLTPTRCSKLITHSRASLRTSPRTDTSHHNRDDACADHMVVTPSVFDHVLMQRMWTEIVAYIYHVFNLWRVPSETQVVCIDTIRKFTRAFGFVCADEDATPKTLVMIALALAWSVIKTFSKVRFHHTELFVPGAPGGVDEMNDNILMLEWEVAIVHYTMFNVEHGSMLNMAIPGDSHPHPLVKYEDTRPKMLKLMCKCLCILVGMDHRTMQRDIRVRALAAGYLCYHLVRHSKFVADDTNCDRSANTAGISKVQFAEDTVIPWGEHVDMDLIRYWTHELIPTLIAKFDRPNTAFPSFPSLAYMKLVAWQRIVVHRECS